MSRLGKSAAMAVRISLVSCDSDSVLGVGAMAAMPTVACWLVEGAHPRVGKRVFACWDVIRVVVWCGDPDIQSKMQRRARCDCMSLSTSQQCQTTGAKPSGPSSFCSQPSCA